MIPAKWKIDPQDRLGQGYPGMRRVCLDGKSHLVFTR